MQKYHLSNYPPVELKWGQCIQARMIVIYIYKVRDLAAVVSK